MCHGLDADTSPKAAMLSGPGEKPATGEIGEPVVAAAGRSMRRGSSAGGSANLASLRRRLIEAPCVRGRGR
jgi:hypothetical protein